MDNSTTYHVYRIVCFATGKCYVGRSSGKTREWQHFYHLKNGTHHSSKLQRAFDKYGRAAFYFEVIESGIQATLISERESWWVNHFYAFKGGYNMTEGGETYSSFGKECEWNGITYPSVTGAARANNISEATMFERLSKGYTSDSDMVRPTEEIAPKACVWNGVEYTSLSEAARANGVSAGTVSRWLDMGYTQASDIPPRYNQKTVIWNGIAYDSLTKAAKANNVDRRYLACCIKRGDTCDDDVKYRCEHCYEKRNIPSKIKCVVGGVEYTSLTEAAKANGVTRETIKKRIKQRGE